MMNPLFRQLESDKPHHQADHGINDALGFGRTQAGRQPCRQNGETEEPQERGADRTERKPAFRLNVQLTAQLPSTTKVSRYTCGLSQVTASMVTIIFQRPCFMTSALASSRLLLIAVFSAPNPYQSRNATPPQ